MPAQPSSYNRVHPDDGGKVRTECECGWRNRWHKAGGRPPSLVICMPFMCPKCGKQLSLNTVYR